MDRARHRSGVVRWKAVLNRFPKLSVVRVPVSFLLEPCNVRVLQEGVELVTRSGVLVSLEQHRVGVCRVWRSASSSTASGSSTG